MENSKKTGLLGRWAIAYLSGGGLNVMFKVSGTTEDGVLCGTGLSSNGAATPENWGFEYSNNWGTPDRVSFATQEEVAEYLIEYAKAIGFTPGNKVRECLFGYGSNVTINDRGFTYSGETGLWVFGEVSGDNVCIFDENTLTWANAIKTQKEAVAPLPDNTRKITRILGEDLRVGDIVYTHPPHDRHTTLCEIVELAHAANTLVCRPLSPLGSSYVLEDNGDICFDLSREEGASWYRVED